MNRKTESIRVKQLYGIFLAATLLLGACTQEEGTNEFPQENIPISFSGNVPVMRSVKEYTTTSDLETIGVFAYFTHGNFNEDAATPNFMYNQLVGNKQTAHGLIVRSSSGRIIQQQIKSVSLLMLLI